MHDVYAEFVKQLSKAVCIFSSTFSRMRYGRVTMKSGGNCGGSLQGNSQSPEKAENYANLGGQPPRPNGGSGRAIAHVIFFIIGEVGLSP
jgi:hypothetical protein